MKNKKVTLILLTCVIILAFTGCFASKEEKAQGNAYIEQYKDQITEYISDTYGEEAKVTSLKALFTTGYDVILPTSKKFANGRLVAKVNADGEKFNVLYVIGGHRGDDKYKDMYYTDKNKAKIEKSLRDYIVKAMGEDKIVKLNLNYGFDGIYPIGDNYVDNSYTKFEDLYDKKGINRIECFLENIDVNYLKESNIFSHLEDVIAKGAYVHNHCEFWFINVDKDKIDDVDKNDIEFSDNVDRISAKYPGNTYRIYFGVPDPVRVISQDSKYGVPMSDKDEENKFNRDIY